MDGFKSNTKMQCFKEGGVVKSYKSRHSEKTEMKEDVAQDTKMVKKGVKQHEEALHKGEPKTKLKLKAGGKSKLVGKYKAGGCVGKYQAGGSTTAEEKARMPAGKLPQQVVDEEAMASNTETREMVAGPLRKLKQGVMEKFKSKSKTPVAPMKNGRSVKKYNDGGMVSYDEAMKTSGGAKKLADAKLANILKANPISQTELSNISESGPAKGLRNYGRMYKQGLGMKPDTAYEYKKGGNVKKCAEGGSLKEVDAGENPGLAKLPTNVRNKMGYMRKGGKAC